MNTHNNPTSVVTDVFSPAHLRREFGAVTDAAALNPNRRIMTPLHRKQRQRFRMQRLQLTKAS